VFTVEGAPDGLAVDRDLPRDHLFRPEDRAYPAEERALERVRVDQHEDAPERVVRGDAVRQREETFEPLVLTAAVEGDVLEAFGLAEHSTDCDHQDVEQLVLDLPFTARVLNRFELGEQGFEHGLPLRRERPSL
jgi:hypothetical protein